MSKVRCPLCGKFYKEINNSHLNSHSLTVSEYDKLYPNYPRLSIEQRKKKVRYQNLTPEMSKKLRKSHTLEGYKEKYGAEEGIRKYNESKINKKLSKTLDNYMRLYGEKEGTQKYNNYQKTNATKMTLGNFIKNHGEKEGTQKYNKFIENVKKSHTLEGYKEKYGTDEGIKRWEEKNLKNSLSSMKVPPEEQDNFKLYKTIVMRFTKKTIRENTIPDIGLIERGKYSLDHKYSQLEGFKNKIPPYIIGSVKNLEVIKHVENCSKQSSCSMTLIELLEQLELI